MMRRFQPQRWLFFGPGAGFLLLFAGCASMPPGGERAEFQEPPPMERTLSKASRQEPVAPLNAWPDDQWWRQFKSPDLDRIMEIALKENPGLKKAYARLGEAGAVAQVEGARLLPWLDSDNTFRQLRYAKHGVAASFNPALGGAEKTSDTFNPVSIRYEFDFWGKNRAAFDAALGEATAEEAELAETRLLLTTAIARSYIGGATFAQELALIRDMVKVRRQSLTVAETRFHTGLGPADAIVQASVDLENVVRLEASTRSLLIMQQNSARPADGRGP